MGSVVAVTVTYGDRFELVQKVVESALKEGVDKVIIVDNASQEPSRSKLLEYVGANNEQLILISLEDNSGSSGGFSCGLQIALTLDDAESIWLLDDDNVPCVGSLKALILTRDMLLSASNIDDVVLYSYRGSSRLQDKYAVFDGYIKNYSPNNFMGFNCSGLWKRFLGVRCAVVNYPLIRVFIGPYGGMYLSKNTLLKVGLPDERFYLYADDHEFTSRLNKLNIDQFLVYSSRLNDIDESFYNGGYFSPLSSRFKMYYSIRNHVYLSKSHVENKYIYLFNKWIYICLTILRSLRYCRQGKYFSKIKLFFSAIKDGEEECLGRVENEKWMS